MTQITQLHLVRDILYMQEEFLARAHLPLINPPKTAPVPLAPNPGLMFRGLRAADVRVALPPRTLLNNAVPLLNITR